MVSILNKVIEKVAIKFDEKFDLAIIAQLKGYEEKKEVQVVNQHTLHHQQQLVIMILMLYY